MGNRFNAFAYKVTEKEISEGKSQFCGKIISRH
jgi:hypothetical protein